MIWLLRHGDAEQAGDEHERPLTERGRRESEIAGRALGALEARIDACLASPKARALETARIACRELGLEPEAADELAGGEFDPGALVAGRGEVLLVGHEPDLSAAIGRETGARVEIKKGGVAAIEGGELLALLRPDALAAIAD